MHFQTFLPANLRGHTNLYSMGQEFSKREASTKLKPQAPLPFSLLNLFLSFSAVLISRFLGETMGLTPVWSAGRRRFSTTEKSKPEC
jgi:hypothetical protein